MNDDYFIHQNLLNNIDNQNYIFNKEKISLDNNITNSSSGEGSKTIENTDESYGIEELPEEIDYIQNFRDEKKTNPFQFNNHSNSLNLKTIPQFFNFSNTFNTNSNINNGNFNKLPPQKMRKTHGFNPVHKNLYEFNKRHASGEKPPARKMQSKYSSASENKYNFIHRLNINPKFGLDSNFGNLNYAPVNEDKILKNNENELNEPITNYTFRNTSLNYNTGNDINSNSNHGQTPSPQGINYITENNTLQNKNFGERENRFKNSSIYSFNTINGTKLQNNFHLLRDEQTKTYNPNKNINDEEIFSNYNIIEQTDLPDYFQIKNNTTKDEVSTPNYQNNQILTKINNEYNINNDINLGNQRLTVGYKYLNEGNNNKFQNNFYGTFNQNQGQNQQMNFNQNTKNVQKQNNQLPEVAVVTKINSAHKNNTNLTKNKKNINNNNNLNILGINQDFDQIFNQINTQTINNMTNNLGTLMGETNNQIINNINLQMLNNRGMPIQNNNNIVMSQNNNIIPQTINHLNQNKIINNINSTNQNQIINNQITKQNNQNQIINNQTNNFLTKGVNQINQNQFVSPSPIIPSQTTPRLTSNYSTLTNSNLNHQTLKAQNLNNLNSLNHIDNANSFGQGQNYFNTNQLNALNTYNTPESERATIVNDKINTGTINNINKQLNNDVDVTYNDFDGSGYIKNYGGVSRPGKDSSGKQKINQDALVCITNINNIKDFNIFGVLDGHGPEGHFISQFASEFIPSQLINNPEIKNLIDTEQIYRKYKENNCKIITQAFIAADNQIKTMEFDASESGSTCCLVLHIGTHIICANTGDSRALVVYDESGDMNPKNLNFLKAVPLSIDYKPELPEEQNRILMAGGVVEQFKDEYGIGAGPYRVWARGEDSPGLAMSRSIGDLKGKSLGVIPDPGILEYDLNKSTKYIIACSDGVWEFLNNDTVKDIGKKFYLENNASAFCYELVSQSLLEWAKNDNIVDDITAVVAFF